MKNSLSGLRGWRTLLVVLPVPLVLLAALGGLGIYSHRVCDAQSRASAAAPEWQHHGDIKAALIGDSWAVGDGRNPAYPELVAQALNLDLRVSAVGGTGYLNEGACGGEDFATRTSVIPRDAQLVLLAGGLNDTGEEGGAVARAVEEVISDVRRNAPQSRVVVVGVPDVPLLDERASGHVDDLLRSTSANAFLDVRDVDVSLLADGIHPSPAGHRQYAKQLIAELSE